MVLAHSSIFNTGRDIEYDLRNDLFVHLSHLGADFYDKHKVGDLMSRMVNDLDRGAHDGRDGRGDVCRRAGRP